MTSLFKGWRKRVQVILMGAASGKTTLHAGLKKYASADAKHDVHILDLDVQAVKIIGADELKQNLADGDHKLTVFPELIAGLKKQVKKFKKDAFIVITSSMDFVAQLELPKDNIHVYLPGSDLWNEIQSKLNDEVKIIANKSRDLITHEYGRAVTKFASLDKLIADIEKKFNLKLIL